MILRVLVIGALLSAAGTTWEASSRAGYALAVRAHDRARARAAAQAGWERARAALSAGRDPSAVDAPALDGHVTTRVVAGASGARQVIVEAVVSRRDGEPVHARLVVTVDASGAVVARDEGGS